MDDLTVLRKQFDAPDLENADRKELIEYIKRLEQGVIDLAHVRNQLYDALANK